jgi:4-amino-4-deoxy-L-arabinose transferase-like glycosyltransferase
MNPSILPVGAYTSVFMLAGEMAMRLLNLSMYSFGFLLLESFTRQRWGGRTGFLAALFGALTPFTHWTIGICFVDSFMFAFSTLVLAVTARFIESRQAVLLPVLGLVAALGYLTKQQMIFVIIPIAAPILVTALQSGGHSRKNVLLNICLASLIFGAVISPPLIHNYILSGNPLFPFYNSIFKSPYFPQQDFADGRWNQPLSLGTLWTITFSGSKFVENSDFSFGFAPLVLFPAILAIGLYRAAKKDLWILGLFLFNLAYACVCFSTTGLYMRYFVGLIAPLSLCLALTSNTLLSLGRSSSGITALVVGCLAAGNFAALLSGDHTAAPYPIFESLSGSLERSSMAYHERFKKLFHKGRLLCSRNSLGLLIDSPANYFAQTRLISNSWLFTTVSSRLGSAASTEELRSVVFDQLEVCYVIMPLSPAPTGVRSPEFRRLLKQVGKTSDFGLYVPRKGT